MVLRQYNTISFKTPSGSFTGVPVNCAGKSSSRWPRRVTLIEDSYSPVTGSISSSNTIDTLSSPFTFTKTAQSVNTQPLNQPEDATYSGVILHTRLMFAYVADEPLFVKVRIKSSRSGLPLATTSGTNELILRRYIRLYELNGTLVQDYFKENLSIEPPNEDKWIPQIREDGGVIELPATARPKVLWISNLLDGSKVASTGSGPSITAEIEIEFLETLGDNSLVILPINHSNNGIENYIGLPLSVYETVTVDPLYQEELGYGEPWDFGNVGLNESVIRTFRIKNNLTTPFEFQILYIPTDGFSINTSMTNFSLPANGDTTFSATFTPTGAVGYKYAGLALYREGTPPYNPNPSYFIRSVGLTGNYHPYPPV